MAEEKRRSTPVWVKMRRRSANSWIEEEKEEEEEEGPPSPRLRTASEEDPPSLGFGALLLDIFVIFIDNNLERLFSRDLAAALNCFTDRPWVDLRKGKAIDELWLSKQLRPYGIRPRSIRLGTQTAKGYLLDDFKDTFKRYIPKSEIDALKSELAERTDPAPENQKPSGGQNEPASDASGNSSTFEKPAPQP